MHLIACNTQSSSEAAEPAKLAEGYPQKQELAEARESGGLVV